MTNICINYSTNYVITKVCFKVSVRREYVITGVDIIQNRYTVIFQTVNWWLTGVHEDKLYCEISRIVLDIQSAMFYWYNRYIHQTFKLHTYNKYHLCTGYNVCALKKL